MDWNLFWSAFGAIGGTLGAVATTAAVGTRGGIQVRSNRIFASYEDADSSIHKKTEKRTGYRSPYDYIH